MKTAPLSPPVMIRRADYAPPQARVETVQLTFDLAPEKTLVRATLAIRRAAEATGPLVLNGDAAMTLLSVRMDGAPLADSGWQRTPDSLILTNPPARFVLETETLLNPRANTQLEGLYQSAGMFCTQCEAEGFRRITFFPDRPDVMSRYTVTLRASRKDCPVLLSNGNLVDSGGLPDGRHYAVWEDPFPKPSYLFALVAGDLACVEDSFTTRSGRTVRLRIFVEHGSENRAAHAMNSLKQAMRWDETRFGLEYDLDLFNIVAVPDFNMGAMENKSLNIFNAKYVLADPETATDDDAGFIETIVGHEYFHNWTGNRVTCRDWFQLSLKEGLTVFRDQEFVADRRSRAVKRIEDVRLLRSRQFAEDAGPLAHPVRPDSYMEIRNFYTATVYEKGAEVVRMLHTLLGEAGFRAGMDLYFRRHDGQAVTCDDFLAAMADANGRDLTQFSRWYSQAGTPRITVETAHDAASGRFLLTLTQTAPGTAGDDSPLHIPLRLALLDAGGQPLAARLDGGAADTAHLLELRQNRQTFTFDDVTAPPVLSLNRGFSAPVILTGAHGGDWTDTAFLMMRDSDPFTRWDATERHVCRLVLEAAGSPDRDRQVADTALLDAIAAAATDGEADPAFRALLLTLPSADYLAGLMTVIDVDGLFQARNRLRREIARTHAPLFERLYASQTAHALPGSDPARAGHRALRNAALGWLAVAAEEAAAPGLWAHFQTADCMTDQVAALRLLADIRCEERDAAFAAFYARWSGVAQVMDKWFSLQAVSSLPDTLDQVRTLMRHPLFRLDNPNRVRALAGAFCQGNMVRFHAADGSGYAFLADTALKLDRINPQGAARLLEPLTRWRRFAPPRQEQMRQTLDRILAADGLSPDVLEIATKLRGGTA